MSRLSELRRKVAEAERRAEGKPKGSKTHVTLARARAELQEAELQTLRTWDPETRRSGGVK